MKLETKIKEILKDWSMDDTFDVVFYGMLNDGYGWSVNDAWRGRIAVEIWDIPETIRERWEVIAANYGRQSVGDLEDISYTDDVVMLESNGFPICELRVNR